MTIRVSHPCSSIEEDVAGLLRDAAHEMPPVDLSLPVHNQLECLHVLRLQVQLLLYGSPVLSTRAFLLVTSSGEAFI